MQFNQHLTMLGQTGEMYATWTAHPYYIAQTAYLQGVEDSGVELPPPVLVYCLANRDIATLLEAMQMSERAFEASMKGANNVRF